MSRVSVFKYFMTLSASKQELKFVVKIFCSLMCLLQRLSDVSCILEFYFQDLSVMCQYRRPFVTVIAS